MTRLRRAASSIRIRQTGRNPGLRSEQQKQLSLRSKRILALLTSAIFVFWLGAAGETHAQPVPNPGQSPISQPTIIPSPGPTESTSNPFPSPTPSGPLGLRIGYVAAGYFAGSSNGGQVPPTPGSTSTPVPFSASHADGFWLDALARFSPSFLAQLMYDNYAIYGADHPYVSYAQGRLLYEPPGTHKSALQSGFGFGFISAQRSTSNANSNSFGLGLNLWPNSSGLLPYGSVYFYPHVVNAGQASSLTSVDAGVMYLAPRRGGFFVRAGFAGRFGLPANTSPTSSDGLEIGLGTTF